VCVATISNIDLSDLIISLATAVADADRALDTARASYGITRFEVETRIAASVSVPPGRIAPEVKLRKLKDGVYGVEPLLHPRVSGLVLRDVIHPTLQESTLPSTARPFAQVQVKALIEPIPRVVTSGK